MEVADRQEVNDGTWRKIKYSGLSTANNYTPFCGVNMTSWHFMRTCPETFQKRMVKKTVEHWINIYDKFNGCYYESEDAAKYGQDKKQKLIACVKLTGKYEVEE